MAIVNCPECSKEISDKAKSCPGCGFPLFTPEVRTNSTKSINEFNSEWIAILLLCGFLGFLGAHHYYSKNISKAKLIFWISIISIVLSFAFIGIIGLAYTSIMAIIDFIKILSEQYTDGDGNIIYKRIR
jgi:uncharacterized membrane protein YvbJ